MWQHKDGVPYLWEVDLSIWVPMESTVPSYLPTGPVFPAFLWGVTAFGLADSLSFLQTAVEKGSYLTITQHRKSSPSSWGFPGYVFGLCLKRFQGRSSSGVYCQPCRSQVSRDLSNLHCLRSFFSGDNPAWLSLLCVRRWLARPLGNPLNTALILRLGKFLWGSYKCCHHKKLSDFRAGTHVHLLKSSSGFLREQKSGRIF